MIVGVECTAHTFGVGVVENGKVLSNVREMYKPKKGGIVPMESAKHHREVAEKVWEKAIEEEGISLSDIEAVAVSNSPGLAPCLLAGLEFAKKKVLELSELKINKERTRKINNKFGSEMAGNTSHGISKSISEKSGSLFNNLEIGEDKNKKIIPLIPVNHCIAHLEIGRHEGAKDPVLLYASGANTQIIAFSSGKYRVFGETLDSGIGNFIDTFARYAGIAFPGGPEIEKLAEKHRGEFVELPYSIKGMDVSFSGMLTKLKQLYDKGNKIENLSYALQEHAFAMLVEATERALAHTGKNELVLGGGVACNKRLQEMCKIMCKERGAKFFCPENSLLVDNGAMIGFTGEVMLKGLKSKKSVNSKKTEKSNVGLTQKPKYDKILREWRAFDKIDIAPRERTDEVDVFWR